MSALVLFPSTTTYHFGGQKFETTANFIFFRSSPRAFSMATKELPEYDELNYGTGAKWIKHLTKNRLDTFTGGHFSDVNLSSVLFTHRLSDAEHVKLEVWSAPGLTKPSFQEAMMQKFKPARKGDQFGPSCEYTIILRNTTNAEVLQGYVTRSIS